jgi:hypothetical protein
MDRTDAKRILEAPKKRPQRGSLGQGLRPCTPVNAVT